MPTSVIAVACRPETHATIADGMTTDRPARERVQRSLAAFELAAIQHRQDVRRRLRVGDEELTALLYLAHHGGVLQHRLARATSLSRSGAGAMLQRLEERGYVRRRADPADRRLRLVELSPAARDQVEDAYGAYTDLLDRLLEHDDPAKVTELARLLDELAAGVTPVGANCPEPAELDDPDADTGEPIWRHWA
jgi:DNA-binding MarR family transcriptional regulator